MEEGESSPADYPKGRRMQEVRKATVARGNNFFFLISYSSKKVHRAARISHPPYKPT